MSATIEKALSLTRSITTDTLVKGFEDTDALLEQDGLTTDQKLDIYTARGWIIDVLEERGELHRIGLGDES